MKNNMVLRCQKYGGTYGFPQIPKGQSFDNQYKKEKGGKAIGPRTSDKLE